MKEIIMPKQGLQMTEGLITKWLKEVGDPVKIGEPLFEMETDKLTITIDSGAEGILRARLFAEGDAVPITTTIAYVGEADEPIPGAPPALHKAAPQIPADARFVTPRARMRAAEKGIDLETLSGSGPDGWVIERDVLAANAIAATPLARKEAALQGVALERVSGSGARGKITAADVRAAQALAALTPPAETRIPLRGMRKIIAQRMKESLATMAQANHRMLADMTEAVKAREQLKQAGVKISYNDLVILCAARALSEYPMMNACMTDTEIILKAEVNVGMAVATDNGLLVPVIRRANTLTLRALALETAALGAQAKNNTLSPDALTGGTFTVTNLGMFGVDCFTAIINAPEAGILAVCAMKKQAVVMPDDSVAVRPMMWLSLTYDHRIVDGAPAAQFLGRVKALLETPALLL